MVEHWDKPEYNSGLDPGYGDGNGDIGYGSGGCSYDRGSDSDEAEDEQRIRELSDRLWELDNDTHWKITFVEEARE